MRGELISDSLTMMFPIFVSVVLFASVTSGTKLRANGWPLSTFTLPFIGSTEKPATTVEHDERTSKYGIWEALQQPEEVIKFRLHENLNKLGADNQYILNKTNAHRFHLTLPASKDSACSSFSSRRYELLFSISSDCSVAFDEASVSCENVETGQKLSVDIPGSNNWLQSSAQINCQDMHDLTKEIVDGVDYNTIEGTWARPDLVKCAISLDTWYTPKQKPWSLLGEARHKIAYARSISMLKHLTLERFAIKSNRLGPLNLESHETTMQSCQTSKTKASTIPLAASNLNPTTIALPLLGIAI